MGSSIIEPLFPYRHLDQDTLVKVQARVCPRDKQRIASVIPDLGIHTLIIQTIYKRLAEYVKSNQLHYDDAHQQRLLDYIGATEFFAGQSALLRDAAVGTAGHANSHDDAGRAAAVLQPSQVSPDERTHSQQGNKPGHTSEGEKGKQVTKRQGSKRQVKGGSDK